MSSREPSGSSQSGTKRALPVPETPGAPIARPVPVNPSAPIPISPPPTTPVDPMLPPGAMPAPLQPNSIQPLQQPLQPATNRPVPVQPGDNRPIPVTRPAGSLDLPAGDEEAEEEDVDATTWALENSPPWLISMVFHTVLLIALGLIYIGTLADDGLDIISPPPIYAEKLGEQVEDPLFQAADSKLLELEDPVISLDEEFVEDPLASPPELELTLDANRASSDLANPSIGIALTGREKGMKEALLAAYGGTATTEAAVKMGLEWLKKNQQRDGMWSLTGPYSTGSGVENRTAATAMALLAFQGAGHTHLGGEHKDVVRRAWIALLKQQAGNGDFFREGSAHHRLYTHAQATIALCELYGMTRDAKYKKPAQKALDYCFSAQSPEGGWRYAPRSDSDTSVTGWFVMAAQSGLMAGLRVPSDKLDRISLYLDRATTDNGSQYAYKPGYGAKISMTAEGLLCRQYLGWKRDDPRLVRGCNIVGENPINYGDADVYYWYYATQTLHHMGGDWWNKWNAVMRQTVPENQIKIGGEKGSWAPGDDAWGNQGGRLYTTCLSIYMLEVYYRHLPIYKTTLR